MSDPIKVGFGKSIVKININDFPIREFQSILNNLISRVFVLEENKMIKYALVSLDMTSMTNRDIDKMKDVLSSKCKISKSSIWITVTHTFSAPHLKHELKTDNDKETYNGWFRKLQQSVFEAFEDAIDTMQSAKVSVNRIVCPLNVNRNILTNKGWWLGRNLNGASNHLLKVISFVKDNGQTDLIFNYDIQPSVFDHITDDQNRRVITSDIFGVAAQIIEKENKNIVIPLLGAAGDQRPLFLANGTKSFEHNKSLLFEQGEFLAQSIKQCSKGKSSLNIIKNFDVFEMSMSLPAQKQKLSTFEIKPTYHYEFEPIKKKIEVLIYGLKINDIVILGTQPELNSSFADKCLTEIENADTLITTLVNGGLKYLPEEKDFKNITYEAMNTMIGWGADKVMLDKFKKINNYIKGDNPEC